MAGNTPGKGFSTLFTTVKRPIYCPKCLHTCLTFTIYYTVTAPTY